MTKKIRVKVTKEDIAMGIRRDDCECPIALAIKRAAKTSDVSVGFWTACLGSRLCFPLPKEARDFVRVFDAGVQVKPFAFTLEASL
jgi:hypothetical protein